MNRADLIDRVRNSVGLSRADSESAVDAVLETVMSAVQGGDRVSLFGFGTFAPSSRAARTGRNPRTGDPVKIAASTGVRFSPSAAFKASLNPKKAAKKSAPKAAPSKTTKAAVAPPAPAKKATKAIEATKALKATKAAPAKKAAKAATKKR